MLLHGNILGDFRNERYWVSEISRRTYETRWLERFIQIGTSEMYGSVSHATKEDEPIKATSHMQLLK